MCIKNSAMSSNFSQSKFYIRFSFKLAQKKFDMPFLKIPFVLIHVHVHARFDYKSGLTGLHQA